MLKFFRRIRRNLLDSGNLKKYSVYAIGEILLVVIGILIALQLDNLNTERELMQRQNTFMEQLKVDLQESENGLKAMRGHHHQLAKSAGKIVHAYWKPEQPKDTILDHFLMPISYQSYQPNMGTANSLINSGNIDLIKSEKIRTGIISYIESVQSKMNEIARYEQAYFREGVSTIKNSFDIWSFLSTNNPDFTEKIPNLEEAEFYPIPAGFQKIPFQITLDQVFDNQMIYSGYLDLLVGHRNTMWMYDSLLIFTQDLINILEDEGF